MGQQRCMKAGHSWCSEHENDCPLFCCECNRLLTDDEFDGLLTRWHSDRQDRNMVGA